MTDKMTDFDALIDNVVESAKECENEHEHRGFYIDSIEKNYAAASSALREAIAALEAELKEADADAERLANKLIEYADIDDAAGLENGGTFTEPYKFIDEVIELHNARLSKRGQGIGKGSVEEGK